MIYAIWIVLIGVLVITLIGWFIGIRFVYKIHRLIDLLEFRIEGARKELNPKIADVSSKLNMYINLETKLYLVDKETYLLYRIARPTHYHPDAFEIIPFGHTYELRSKHYFLDVIDKIFYRGTKEDCLKYIEEHKDKK